MKTSLILLMLLFVAAGCGGTEESSTNPTSLASPVSTTVSSAATLTPTPAPPVPTSAPEPEPTPLPTQTPLPPPGVVVDLEIANVTENSITLQWKPPDNSNVVPIEHYEATRDIAFWPDEHHAVAETTFIDTELESSTEHRYRVRAIGPGGIEGAEISIVGSTLDSATPAPTPRPTATSIPERQVGADKVVLFEVIVWQFCTAFLNHEVDETLIVILLGMKENPLSDENANRVHDMLVATMTTASTAEEAELLAVQTYRLCEQWRSEDPQPAWLTPTAMNSVDLPSLPESNQPQRQSTVGSSLGAGEGEDTPTPTVVPSPTPAASGGCSPVDLPEVHELIRPYARGVACIEADNRQGTGFVVRNTESGEGYLLTNAHVIGVGPTSVVAHLENVAYSAEVIRFSDERDLAMVRICCGDFVVLRRANRGEFTGESVLALGFPGGEFTASHGMVRGVIHRGLNTYLEHTADVQPGGSGGALLAFPLKAILRAKEGKGLSLEEGETLGVLGVTVAKSTEYDYTTYTIWQSDTRHIVGNDW